MAPDVQTDDLTQLQLWKATMYLMPLLGAYLADAVMGRFWVILVFSLLYFLVRGPRAVCSRLSYYPSTAPSRQSRPTTGNM